MNYETKGASPFPVAQLHLSQNESIQIESGSMIYHNTKVSLQGHMNNNGKKGLGGLMSAVGRKLTSGETFFITTATGTANDAELAIAPSNPGVIETLTLTDQQQWRLNSGAFLAMDTTAQYKMVQQDVGSALFGGTGGLFIMETAGTGTMLISAYGAILPLDLNGETDYVVDNAHVVAWSSQLNYKIEAASGTFGFKTGEGLVNRFSGTGRIYVQTRNLQALANLIQGVLPKES
ncbi:TIGR00266 family protein [Lapidilactobacillus bayanensis]|uniref:TIGR00266 family protein n=1 Tax=Lapidilactobacillus bayanensis TaxID=2485998 RepID=UPI000F79A3F7|nr:TIGR00266 family protein [Lapidilactobacillus bayanensis]